MSGEKLTPKFQGAMQLQSALMGLTLAFKKEYGDEALGIAKSFTKQLGIKTGNLESVVLLKPKPQIPIFSTSPLI